MIIISATGYVVFPGIYKNLPLLPILYKLYPLQDS